MIKIGARIRLTTSPELTVDSTGAAFSDVSSTHPGWVTNSSTGAVTSPPIDGEILKLYFKVGGGCRATAATITIKDSITGETIYAKSTDLSGGSFTVYPRQLVVTTAVGTADVTANEYVPHPIIGKLYIDIEGAEEGDAFQLHIFHR